MKKISSVLILILALCSCQKGKNNFELPSLISDNMVLQQKSNVNIWGKANPGQKVTVSASWKAASEAKAGEDGKWLAKITTPEAGGPYTMTISCRDTILTINNILIGEVWFCSGQSNMEMPVAGWPPNDTVMYSAKTIAAASIPGIHLFNVLKKVSDEPLEECTGKWEVCSPSSVNQFSATAFFFGNKINEELHIPVGLIESAWGGTPSEAWTSAGALEGAGEYIQELKAVKESAPKQAEYQKWLNSHKQVTLNSDGKDQYKNLDFNDSDVPEAGFNDSAWPAMKLPGMFETVTGDFDGAVWFRKTIDLPENMTGKDLVLALGPIDDMDRTFFNGRLVGSTEESGEWKLERVYDVPKDVVKSGANVISVRVLDIQGGGGIYGMPGSMKLTVKDNGKEQVDLGGDWKFQPAAEFIGNKFYLFDMKTNEFSTMERPKSIGPSTPSSLYNGMVSSVAKYRIKGAIWYQGEANVGRADQYSKIFPLMITDWRNSWGIKDFPFYFVQIAPYVYSGVDSTESAYLREAQGKALEMPNTGMAVTLDIATVMNIHPPFKKEVGERLANLALAKDYGMNVRFSGPVCKSIKTEGRIIKITFDNMTGSLKAKNGKLTEFEIAGKDGKYVKADAKIEGSEVWVSSPKISNPESVRYCWHNGSIASLFDSDGMAAWQFRTDAGQDGNK
jgi:sialate O-acetylesterase